MENITELGKLWQEESITPLTLFRLSVIIMYVAIYRLHSLFRQLV